MLQNKRFSSLILVTALVGLSSWGFLVHRTINQISIYNLPEPLRSFFHKDKANLIYNSVRPDIRRNTDKTEGSKHYIDLEKFGPNAVNNMPMDWATAVKKYSEDTLKEYGWGPYNAIMQLNNLTKAFKSGNADSIYFYAADLAHYIGDLHVPLHTTDNHDGQLTGQKGMHALWESTIPELTIQQYMLYNNHKATYIKEYFYNYYLHNSDVTIELANNNIKVHYSETESFKVTVRLNIIFPATDFLSGVKY